MPSGLTRRELIRAGGVLLAGAGTFGAAAKALAGQAAASQPASIAPRRRALRFAHLTDSHVQPERRGAEGLAACLRHLRELSDSPELIVTGGDLIMDAAETPRARTQELWDLYLGALRAECRLPIAHCLGNHDVWGWAKAKCGATGQEPDYGKKWALDVLQMPRSYHSFDRGGWHFVVLDSISPHGESYIGRLDDEQFEWLAADLDRTPATTPVVVISHIPIVSVIAYFAARDEDKRGEWAVPGGVMHLDARRLRALFNQHANVKLCLSGHLHQLDRISFEGVTYICDGAVCGAWWKGRNVLCSEGYGVIDLYSDGTFEHSYETYGWKA